VYTEHARRNLLAEGLPPRRILLTGSPMREMLDHFADQIDASKVLERLGLEPGQYFLVSAHREENVDYVVRLRTLLAALQALRRSSGKRVVISTHPRTRKRLESISTDAGSIDGLEFAEPFGFFDYCQLQKRAACVLSDSGTISEESAILDFPAVTIRDSMERPEALDAGTILMCGLDPSDVLEAVTVAIRARSEDLPRMLPPEYQVPDVSRRTVNFIMSTAGRHAFWAGLHDR
jgi:UDP-N-acetylglucosamine 2-epimerase (non-hydrolysing)